MKKKFKAILVAVQITVKQRVCKHTYRVNIHQSISIDIPLKYECTKCNKVVYEQRKT